MTNATQGASIEQLLRDLTPHVVASVTRRFLDFAAAEDAAQEAAIAAAVQWPRDGLPDNPRAWLTHVAMRRMTDHIRAESARRRHQSELAAETAAGSPAADKDDTLTLLFMCCHPALSTSSAIALTLRAVGGLTTAEIAHAYLVPEATMAQRISRAKQTIKNSGTPFQLPTPDQRDQRFRAVMHVLYLMFNEGYASSGGSSLLRNDLAGEAIRLARSVRRLLPENAEAAGLLALMLLTDARRLARTTGDGELIPLTHQDRSLWNERQITEGVEILSGALPRGAVGQYQLLAAIAAVHDEAPRAEDTDWPQILALYTLLRRLADSPMVALNQAIAVAMVHGPKAGLARLEALAFDPRLTEQHRLDATRAHLLELAGEFDGAINHYRAAATKTGSQPERNYLLTQAARLSARQ